MRKQTNIWQAVAIIALLFLVACADDMGRQGGNVVDADKDIIAFQVTTEAWGQEKLTDSTTTEEGRVTASYHVTKSSVRGGELPVLSLYNEPMDNVRSLESIPARSTRAVEKNTFVQGTDEFEVSCFILNDPDNTSSGLKPYFVNQIVNWKTDKWQTTEEKYLWRKSPNMKFYAHWPLKTGDSEDITFNPTTKEISFKLDDPKASGTYEDTSDLSDLSARTLAAEKQRDLLYAVTDFYGKDGTQTYADGLHAKLQFKHALTAIQICSSPASAIGQAVGTVTIKSVKFMNMAFKGTFNTDTEEWTVEEDDESDLRDFTVRPSATGVNPSKTAHTVLNGGDLTFYMIPQSFSSIIDGKLKQVQVVYDEDGVEKIVTANLAGMDAAHPWKAGQTVKYILGTKKGKSYLLFGSCSNNPEYNETNTGKLDIHSYMMNVADDNSVTLTNQSWKVTGVSTDGGITFTDAAAYEGTADGWLPNISQVKHLFTTPSDYSGNATTETFYTTDKMDNLPDDVGGRAIEIDELLQDEPSVTDFDLSLYDAHTVPIVVDGEGNASEDGRSTANCYVVSAPGSYKFPAIYGNGLRKNTIYNTSSDAYSNYDGAPFSSRCIWEDQKADGTDVVPVDAVLLWQQSRWYDCDAEEWVNAQEVIDETTVHYNAFTHEVHFNTVAASKLHQGNAVIALRDASGTIIWSWHIWVTSAMRYRVGSTVDSKMQSGAVKAGNYYFMPEILGAVYSGPIRYYNQRSAILRIQQTDESGNILPASGTTKIYVRQNSGINYQLCEVGSCYYQPDRKDPIPCFDDRNGTTRLSLRGDYHQASGSTTGQQTYQWSIQNPNVFWPRPDNTRWNAYSNKFTNNDYKYIYDPLPYPYRMLLTGGNIDDRTEWMYLGAGGDVFKSATDVGSKTISTPYGQGYQGAMFTDNDGTRFFWVATGGMTGLILTGRTAVDRVLSAQPYSTGNGNVHVYAFITSSGQQLHSWYNYRYCFPRAGVVKLNSGWR